MTLHDHCRAGDVSKVESLFGWFSKPDVNQLNEDDETPLLIATHWNNISVVEFLISKGALIDKPSAGKTPLMEAAKKGHFDLIKLLVQSGAHTNAIDMSDWTPLFFLVYYHDDTTILDYLITNGADIHHETILGETCLHVACRKGRSKSIKLLLEKGAKVNSTGETPLHRAIEANSVESVDILLKYGADISTLSKSLGTPLEYCKTFTGNDQQIELLVENARWEPKYGSRNRYQGERLALLIGNEAYSDRRFILTNPVNDIHTIASKLQECGFRVIPIFNCTSKAVMEQKVTTFANQICEMDSTLECCLIYYAGHGLQYENINYLVPTQAKIEYRSDIKTHCVPLDWILSTIAESASSSTVQLSMIDACRNELRTRGTNTPPTTTERGLSFVKVPTGSFGLFSTLAGQVSLDVCSATSKNSPFAYALSEILKENIAITQLSMMVTKRVRELTNTDQTPYFGGALDSEFYF